MLLFCSMADEEKDEEEERDEKKKEEGLERFLWSVNSDEFNPLTLSFEPASNAKNNLLYYPTVIVKGGYRVKGNKALNSAEIKGELSRLQKVLIQRGYDIKNLELPI